MKIAAVYARVSTAKQQLNENIASRGVASKKFSERFPLNYSLLYVGGETV
jgi:hypothetical protein